MKTGGWAVQIAGYLIVDCRSPWFFPGHELKPYCQSHPWEDSWKWGAEHSHMEVHAGLMHCVEELTRKGKGGTRLECPPPCQLGLRALPRCRTFYRANKASESL